MSADAIANRFREAGVPLDGRDSWKVQGTPVIKHSALERLAAACGITFDPPTIVRAQPDEAVMCVTGRMADKAEWSFGEARIGLNYQVSGKQAGYPYAMAEKRARNRVIIKLVGLHGVYSSEEADAFTARDAPDEPSAKDKYVAATAAVITTWTGPKADLVAWWNSQESKQQRRDFGLTTDEVEDLKAKVIAYQEPQREAAE